MNWRLKVPPSDKQDLQDTQDKQGGHEVQEGQNEQDEQDGQDEPNGQDGQDRRDGQKRNILKRFLKTLTNARRISALESQNQLKTYRWKLYKNDMPLPHFLNRLRKDFAVVS